MDITTHAISRFQQRGIPLSICELIYEFGEATDRPGGVSAYNLSGKIADQLVHELKITINRIEQAKSKTLIVDDQKEIVITGYYNEGRIFRGK